MGTIKITNNDKFVLLTADCGYGKRSWEELILPGVVYNKEELLESLKWVQLMSGSPNCVEVLANHDAEVKPHIISL